MEQELESVIAGSVTGDDARRTLIRGMAAYRDRSKALSQLKGLLKRAESMYIYGTPDSEDFRALIAFEESLRPIPAAAQ